MFSSSEPDAQVEKLMSFTQTEFEAGLNRLTDGALGIASNGAYDLSAAAKGKPVTCTFDPQPDAVLGGLVRLPRVRVVIEMSALSTAERATFLSRFEQTFQRGGG